MTAPAEKASLLRTLGGLAGIAIVNALLLTLGSRLFVLMLFSPVLGLVYLVLALAAVIVIDALILRNVRGHSSIAAGIFTALVGVGLTVGVFANLGLDDVYESAGQIPVVAGFVSALVAALFMPGRWLRAVGAAALVAAIAILVVPSLVASARHVAEREAAAADAEAAAVEFQVANSTFPYVTDLPGSTVFQVQPSDYISGTWIDTADGGGMWIETVGESSDSGTEAHACWLMVGDPGSFDETVTMEYYTGVCELVAPDQWATADGTSIAVTQNGTLVLLSTAPADVVRDIGATRPATTDELWDAARYLRLLTPDQLRDYLLNSPVDPDGR